MPNLIDLQLLMYDKLTQKQFSKFRNIFLQKLPSDKPVGIKPHMMWRVKQRQGQMNGQFGNVNGALQTSAQR